jgi:hypothetical protein
MSRKGSSNLFRWVWVAAVLLAIGFGGASSSAAAVVCAEKAAEPCARPGAAGWTTAIVEIRERKAQLEAIRFAERVKRHLGRQLAMRKVQFAKSQARLERQRRAHKRHAKAQQFAEARRHVAKHMHKLQPAAKGHLRRFVHNAPQDHRLNGSNSRPALHWRALWRHDAHNDVPQQRAN